MGPPSRSRRWSSIGELVGVRSRPWAGRKSSKRCGLCSLYPCPDYLAVLAAESLVKGMTELAVPGVDQEPERLPTCLPSQGQRSTSAACPWHSVAARSARTDARRQERRSDTVVRRAATPRAHCSPRLRPRAEASIRAFGPVVIAVADDAATRRARHERDALDKCPACAAPDGGHTVGLEVRYGVYGYGFAFASARRHSGGGARHRARLAGGA